MYRQSENNLLSSNISSRCPHNMVNFGPLAADIVRQPNFAALNREHHLYSAGRPSRWASAHILVLFVFCLFLCTVTDFSAPEKDRGVKFCMCVVLLSGQVFSPFGELLLAGSHGGGITSGMNGSSGSCASERGMGIRNWGRRRCLKPYGGICILQAC